MQHSPEVKSFPGCSISFFKYFIPRLLTAAGTDHILALTNDGTVLSWGSGLVGQLGRVGSRMQHPEETQLTPAAVPFKRTRGVKASSKIVVIAAGPYTSFACTDDGHVFAWGLNNYGQLGFASKVGFF